MGAFQSAPAATWPPGAHEELARIHELRSTPFDPDGNPAHLQLLRAMWQALLPHREFERSGEAWKASGFQGEDPATDIRGGGLLAVHCISSFAMLQTGGLRQMLKELAQSNRASMKECYYPIAALAVVICSKLCDALGLSDGMYGPISPSALQDLLAKPPASPLVKFLTPAGRRGGFVGLFYLLLADFHVRFLRSRSSYMMAQPMLTEAFDLLRERAAHVQTLELLERAYYAAEPKVEVLLDKSDRMQRVVKMRAVTQFIMLGYRAMAREVGESRSSSMRRSASDVEDEVEVIPFGSNDVAPPNGEETKPRKYRGSLRVLRMHGKSSRGNAPAPPDTGEIQPKKNRGSLSVPKMQSFSSRSLSTSFGSKLARSLSNTSSKRSEASKRSEVSSPTSIVGSGREEANSVVSSMI